MSISSILSMTVLLISSKATRKIIWNALNRVSVQYAECYKFSIRNSAIYLSIEFTAFSVMENTSSSFLTKYSLSIMPKLNIAFYCTECLVK